MQATSANHFTFYAQRNSSIAGVPAEIIARFGAASNELEVTVYPNPSTGVFNIVLSSEQVAKIDVLDLSGRELLRVPYDPDNQNAIHLEGFASGVYLIKIRAERQYYNGRIVKL